MIGTIKRAFNLLHNMGWLYVAFRVWRMIMLRTGILKMRFPTSPSPITYLTLVDWKQQSGKFFFKNKEAIQIPKNPVPELKERFDQIASGKLLLFNSIVADLGINYNWITNPDSGFNYNKNTHWTEISDYSQAAGDIKYVWEKSRFSYLYDIIRYDYHFEQDCAEMVLSDIISWIESNPVNCGPNYRCSQEMSLRVLNWTFALHYYRNSPHLTESVFDKMQYAIYWHLDHIYKNINFSRIAVRNNHAITESLMLYISGILYPTLPNASIRKAKGKAWFEQEIAYQIYDDGSFLQFSMNYHRVVVQLLTWAIVLAEKNGEKLADVVYDRATRSVQFLRTCMEDENGWLPNYGANDGALFFRLSNAHYRDYRPALHALAAALKMNTGFAASCEECLWYGLEAQSGNLWQPQPGLHSFRKGGYYIMREADTLTFIKCGGYKDRPSHADNLHMDVWYKGENILIDAGSYKYNTDAETMRYFSGTASHNTVMLGNKDQMLKGGHFIWYYWTEAKDAELKENADSYSFTGAVAVYQYLSKNIVHRRTINKKKGEPEWQVVDEVFNKPNYLKFKQLWHLLSQSNYVTEFNATDVSGKEIAMQKNEGWYSGLYGQKEKANEYYFSSENGKLVTIIKLHNPE